MSRSPVCREVVDSIVRDDLDQAVRARIERHIARCESCAAEVRGRAGVRAAVLGLDDRLDDLTRSRVEARLEHTIDERAAVRAGRRSWGSRPALLSAAGLVVVAGVALLFTWQLTSRRNDRSVRAPELAGAAPQPQVPAPPLTTDPPLAPAPRHLPAAPLARSTRPAPAPTRAGRVLTPYAVIPANARGAGRLGEARDRVSVPANTTIRARLVDRAELTLVGPVELAVTSASPELVALELTRGSLVGDYDPAAGGKLRLRTRDATVEVVGTLFAIEASSAGTRVSVAHGKVRVESRGEIVTLTDGQSWSARGRRVQPLLRRASLLFQGASRRSPPESVEPTGGQPPVRQRAALLAQSRPAEPGVSVQRARPQEQPGPDAADRDKPVAPPISPAPPPAAPASPPPPPQLAPPAPPPPVTAASLYRQAELALRQGDDARGLQLLSQLVSHFGADPTADAARFELALILEKAGEVDKAIALTNEIGRSGRNGPFVEPARFLRCRLDRRRPADATTCLTRFVSEHPRSPRHAEALQMLIELHVGAGHCELAAKLAKTYVSSHPDGAFSHHVSKVVAGCAAN